MDFKSQFLGDILVSMGIISRQQLDEALQFQQSLVEGILSETDPDRTELISKSRTACQRVPMLGQILADKGYVTKEQISPVLEIQVTRATGLIRLGSAKLARSLGVGGIINHSIDLVNALSLIMKYANIVTDSMASSLMLIDFKTRELVFSVPTGPDADKLEDIRIPPGAGVAGWVVENEQYALVPDASKDPRFYSGIDAVTRMKTKSILCVPLKSKQKIIGVLEVINKKNGLCFTEEDALLLKVFSHHAAIAIENAMQFDSMAKSSMG